MWGDTSANVGTWRAMSGWIHPQCRDTECHVGEISAHFWLITWSIIHTRLNIEPGNASNNEDGHDRPGEGAMYKNKVKVFYIRIRLKCSE